MIGVNLRIKDRLNFLVADHGLDDGTLRSLIATACGQVSQRIVKLDPTQAENFMSTSPIIDKYGAELLGDVVSVVRENGTAGKYEPCTKIAAHDRTLAMDSNSLKYRTKWNPVYYILNKNSTVDYDGDAIAPDFRQKIYILPTPSEPQDHGLVTQLLYYPNDALIDLESIYIEYEFAEDQRAYHFPQKWSELVLLSVAIQIIDNKLQSIALEEEDEEVFAVFSDMREKYNTKFDTEFSYIAQGNPQKNEEGGAREG